MFVLRNAGLAVGRRPWRSGLTVVAALAVTFGAMVATAVTHQADVAHTTAYDAQEATASIRPTQATMKKYDGTDATFTKQYRTWENYNTYVLQAQQDGVTFKQTEAGSMDYTLSEDMPMRQSDSIKAIAGKDDQPADKTGGELQLRAFASLRAAQTNDWGTYKVVEGKHLDYSNGTKGALISQELAKQNGLKVGDTFTIGHPTDTSKTVELTVRGIYQYDQPAQGTDAKLAKDNRLNAIYVAYPAFSSNKLEPEANEADSAAAKASGWAVPDLNIVFSFNSPKDYQAFAKSVRKAKLPKSLEVISPSLEAYERSLAPLDAAASNARIALWALAVVGGGLTLALTILGAWVGRRGEIANGLLIGATKGRLGWQFMLESFMLTLPAVAVGILAGALAAKPLGTALAGGQTVSMNSTLVWDAIGLGAAAVLALGIVAALAVACFKKDQVFAATEVNA